MEWIIGTIVVVVGLTLLVKFCLMRVTIFEFQRGLRYHRGKFAGVMDPGQYWHVPWFTTINVVDARPSYVTVAGQELLSKDGLSLKVSLAANYETADFDVATHQIEDSSGALYIELQMALRDIVGGVTLDELLAKRQELSAQLMAATQEKLASFGLKLNSVDIKDIMLPGKLKDVYAQVVAAQKEGQAALERARGETAALRCLANAAKMLDKNPALMQLRLIQCLGDDTGNQLVLKLDSQQVSTGPEG